MASTVAEEDPAAPLRRGDRGGKYLVFELDREEFGIRVLQAREITGVRDIGGTTTPYLLGMAKVKGKVKIRAAAGHPTAVRVKLTVVASRRDTARRLRAVTTNLPPVRLRCAARLRIGRIGRNTPRPLLRPAPAARTLSLSTKISRNSNRCGARHGSHPGRRGARHLPAETSTLQMRPARFSHWLCSVRQPPGPPHPLAGSAGPPSAQ
jgi:hypothetical protein